MNYKLIDTDSNYYVQGKILILRLTFYVTVEKKITTKRIQFRVLQKYPTMKFALFEGSCSSMSRCLPIISTDLGTVYLSWEIAFGLIRLQRVDRDYANSRGKAQQITASFLFVWLVGFLLCFRFYIVIKLITYRQSKKLFCKPYSYCNLSKGSANEF